MNATMSLASKSTAELRQMLVDNQTEGNTKTDDNEIMKLVETARQIKAEVLHRIKALSSTTKGRKR